MRILIAVDVSNLLRRAGHFTVATQIVEKHEATIEIDAFENEVSHQRLHQTLLVALLMKLVVAVAYKLVATQQMLVCLDRKSTRLNSSHANISYAVFCLKKKK